MGLNTGIDEVSLFKFRKDATLMVLYSSEWFTIPRDTTRMVLSAIIRAEIFSMYV